jgi:hypothetical protein
MGENLVPADVVPKRRGRPKGSKNHKVEAKPRKPREPRLAKVLRTRVIKEFKYCYHCGEKL